MEYFSTVMNRPFDPENELEIPERTQILDLPMNNLPIYEVEQALKQLNNWKAPGCEGITAEILKAKKEKTHHEC